MKTLVSGGGYRVIRKWPEHIFDVCNCMDLWKFLTTKISRIMVSKYNSSIPFIVPILNWFQNIGFKIIVSLLSGTNQLSFRPSRHTFLVTNQHNYRPFRYWLTFTCIFTTTCSTINTFHTQMCSELHTWLLVTCSLSFVSHSHSFVNLPATVISTVK